MTSAWQLSIDTGGTFTDALAYTPDRRVLRAKVLSSSALRGFVVKSRSARVMEIAPALEVDVISGGAFRLLNGDHTPVIVTRYDASCSVIELEDDPGVPVEAGAPFEILTGREAPVLASHLLTGTPIGHPLPEVSMRLGTTLATNALLTRTGADSALFITRGFGDLLKIGTQQRPDLFALNVVKPPSIHTHTIEVAERVAADGTVLEPLDFDPIEKNVDRLIERGVRSAAVALLHGDRYPAHEEALARWLEHKGFRHISCSSRLAQVIRIVPRAATAVVNACLAPVVEGYIRRIREAMGDRGLLVMNSAGGLAGAAATQPKDMLLSGPAGGVVGAARTGTRSGATRIISFDMGGTSTDVARYDDDYDYVFEHSVGDAHLFAPALSIETVAAGGGSICGFDGTGLTTGPESAGASPGPACYGAGGPLTVTDVNLLLGRLDPDRFGIPVNRKPAEEALAVLLDRMNAALEAPPTAEEALEGYLAIANERMAGAIRRISIRRGYDPSEYALVAFGGAGAQHACAVAGLLGMRRVIVPEDAGLLSACGLAGAGVERFAETQVLKPIESVEEELPRILQALEQKAISSLASEGVAENDIRIRRRIAELRFAGQETALQIEINDDHDRQSARDAFLEKYAELYGFKPIERDVELVMLRVVACTRTPDDTRESDALPAAGTRPERKTTQRAWFDHRWIDVPVFHRERLDAGARIDGPALVFEAHSATVVDSGWRLTRDRVGALKLKRTEDAETMTDMDDAAASRPEAVQVELFSHRFETIAREMGEILRRTSVSTNVKERLDFSCALLDAKGELVVNAPHIPVHLGSLGICVRKTREVLDLGEGDVALTNHPSCGGSHLPDLTVMTPVFDQAGRLRAHLAARAHHAEIGGILPGSMPPAARCLAEEGTVIPPIRVVRKNRPAWDELVGLFTRPPWPTRALDDNLADLKAAVAACTSGVKALKRLMDEQGSERVVHYMESLKARAEQRMRQALTQLTDGSYEAEERLDDGTVLRVRIRICGDEAKIDFTGSSGVHAGNLNATPAIVHSVVIYVLRLLVREDLPLNEGMMRPITLTIPEGILNPVFPDDPSRAPSIVGGNVETSMRLVDTLIKALGLAAAGQGTMNNVLFGDDAFSYYETVCGGCGAGPGFDGASAVHSHMTNTRITDPELLEHRFPVRLERFAIRQGSGGEGRYKGGNGVVREFTFLSPLELSVLSQRRNEGPFGMAGGEPGRPGSQEVIRKSGKKERLDAIDSRHVEPGDRLVLKTPGGGGYGDKT